LLIDVFCILYTDKVPLVLLDLVLFVVPVPFLTELNIELANSFAATPSLSDLRMLEAF